jgi:hypothetical protein
MFSDEQLVKKAAAIRDEQDRWNDVFATKLIEVLDKIDSVRSEVRADLDSSARANLENKKLMADALAASSEAERALKQNAEGLSHLKALYFTLIKAIRRSCVLLCAASLCATLTGIEYIRFAHLSPIMFVVPLISTIPLIVSITLLREVKRATGD